MERTSFVELLSNGPDQSAATVAMSGSDCTVAYAPAALNTNVPPYWYPQVAAPAMSSYSVCTSQANNGPVQFAYPPTMNVYPPPAMNVYPPAAMNVCPPPAMIINPHCFPQFAYPANYASVLPQAAPPDMSVAALQQVAISREQNSSMPEGLPELVGQVRDSQVQSSGASCPFGNNIIYQLYCLV